MAGLSEKRCVPCSAGASPLRGDPLKGLLRQLDGWEVINEHHLQKTYTFPDFRQALAFTNRVGEVAEQEGHHPDILTAWGKVTITVWTHKIDGLTESDFVLAAKFDEARGSLK